MSAEPRTRTRRRAAAFAALGDERRLSLLTRLGSGPPQSISRLAEHSGLTRQGLTRHLRTLENAGLVTSRRVGRESFFKIRSEPLTDLRDYLAKVSAQWDSALERLRQFVE